jgi:hypothetical protein
MIRYITLANDKKRDAEITLKAMNPKPLVSMVLPGGQKPINKKLLKGTIESESDFLMAQYNEKPVEGQDFQLQLAGKLAQDLIDSDPEIDMETCGKFIEESSRIYVNPENKAVFKISKTEKIFTPAGELKEERKPKYLQNNIHGEFPVSWTGKLMPKDKVYNKLVFSKKYQIKHVNGLTYDFLFDMAKQLNDKKALMMMAGGSSGKDPLVMNDGGNPYRAFMEGRVDGNKYCLILHLTDQELKPLPKA